MRINLDLILYEPKISRNYRKALISFLKNILKNYNNGEYFDQFYGKNNSYKEFSWSMKLIEPNFTESKEYIGLGSPEFRVSILVSDLKDALIFYNACMKFKGNTFDYKNQTSFNLVKVSYEKDREIKMPTVLLKVLSPICLRDHDRETNIDRYICVYNDNFISELKKSLINNYPKFYENSINELKVDCSALKKTVVDLFENKIHVSVGHLILSGDVKLLNEILSKGLGSRRGAGFGMLELVEETEMVL